MPYPKACQCIVSAYLAHYCNNNASNLIRLYVTLKWPPGKHFHHYYITYTLLHTVQFCLSTSLNWKKKTYYVGFSSNYILDRTNKNQQQYRNLKCTLVCLTDNQQEFPLTFSFSDELEALITQKSTLRYLNTFSVLYFEKIIKYAKKRAKMGINVRFVFFFAQNPGFQFTHHLLCLIHESPPSSTFVIFLQK